MHTTQSTEARERQPVVPSGPNGTKSDGSKIETPARERDARRELARLRSEIEQLVGARTDDPRAKVDAALESVTRLQIVTANIDACGRPSASLSGRALVALADAHLRGHTDAIERGMTYTADNQIRLLLGE
jgi:phage protein D